MKNLYTYTYSINWVIWQKLNWNQTLCFCKTKNWKVIETETMYWDEAHWFAIDNKMINSNDIIINNKISSEEEIEEKEYKNIFHISFAKKWFNLIKESWNKLNQKESMEVINRIIDNWELDDTIIYPNGLSTPLSQEDIKNLIK